MNRREFLEKSLAGGLLASPLVSLVSACGKGGYKYKIGCFDASMGGEYTANVDALDAAKKLGLDGLQITTKQMDPSKPFMDEATISAYAKRSAETGVLICSVCTNAMSKSPFTYEPNGVSYMKSAIDATAALKCDNILMPFYGPANQQDASKKMDPKHFAPLVSKLRELAPYAEKKGVVISMENAISAEESRRIIDAVGSDHIKVYLDTFNPQYYGHNSIDTILGLKGYIGQVHFKAKEHKFGPSNTMPEDFDGCIDALIKIGYKGWLVLETHGFSPAKHGPIFETLEYNINYLRNSKFFK